MKLGIMQPYFFPYIGYWQLLNEVDVYVIYDDVNFIKGGWINRNRILVNGKPTYFNVQMKGASPFKKINEVEVSDDAVFKRKLLSTLKMSYSKAPYFEQIYPIIENIINNKESSLSRYLEYSIRTIANYLDMNTKIIVSSNIEKNNELKGKEKVIHICNILGATDYINAIGAQEMYDYESFDENGIQLNFLKTNDIIYRQYSDEFVPYLSIIDVLMFNSKEEVKNLLNQFELVNDKNKVKERKLK